MGTPPAGSGAGEEGLQPELKNRRRMTPEQLATLRASYYDAVGEDGALPFGWITRHAEALGFTQQSIQSRVDAWRAMPRKSVPKEPAPPSPRETAIARLRPREEAELAHTETPACWCRKTPASRDNVWCKLRSLEKPAAQHASLRTPQPRVRRMIGTRY